MSLLALLASSTPSQPPTEVDLSPLPDLIPGGERVAPYAMEFPTNYWAPQSAITPTYDGAGHTVHPGVVDMVKETGAPFRGFRFWMAHTPYQNSNVALENPCILVSNHGWEWQDPLGISNPIFGPPTTGGFYGDADLVWDHENQQFFISWVWLAGDSQLTATSKDGVHWDAIGRIGGFGSSPTVVRRGPGDWWMMKGDDTGVGSVDKPTIYRASTPTGPWTEVAQCNFTKPEGAGAIWHYHMAWDELTQRWHWLGVDRSWRAFPAVSVDGINWHHGPYYGYTSNYYRPCIVLDGDHYNVWGSRGEWRLQYVRMPRSRWDSIIIP